MTTIELSASKTFSVEDQRQFAVLSGDHNPMHMDPIAARRTQAGAPVVHGIHLLLWGLDAFAASEANRVSLKKIKIRFNKFVYVGETAHVQITDRKPASLKLSISVAGMSVSQITLDLGEPKQGSAASDDTLTTLALPSQPLDLTFERMADMAGRLPFATPPATLSRSFPAAATWLDARRIAALAATTTLVGMVCPGLHSMYSSLTVELREDDNAIDGIEFRVESTDERFRMLRTSIVGGGISGSIDSFARVPPTAQPSVASLANLVARDEFAGSTALIIGGSRGIGELTAKLIAAGGGKAIITYAVGKTDAQKVVDEINAAQGACEAWAYDVRKPVSAQLAGLAHTPTHLYYFATPPIFGRQSDAFSPERLNDFMQVYVDGFWSLTQMLRQRCKALAVFYPSSVAVTERPRGMTEYAMAKAAGEILCADMNDILAPTRIIVSRLPRMETDQTATFMPVDSSSALETMLPLIRQVHMKD